MNQPGSATSPGRAGSGGAEFETLEGHDAFEHQAAKLPTGFFSRRTGRLSRFSQFGDCFRSVVLRFKQDLNYVGDGTILLSPGFFGGWHRRLWLLRIEHAGLV